MIILQCIIALLISQPWAAWALHAPDYLTRRRPRSTNRPTLGAFHSRRIELIASDSLREGALVSAAE